MKSFNKLNPVATLFICFFISFIMLDSAYAQKIKIKKVKGRTALIESSIPLEEGKTYDLKTDVISADVNYSNIGFKSRQNSFTLGFNLGYLNGNTVQNTAYNVQARYGWNFSYVEFGAVGQLSYVDKGNGGTTDYSIGGYFDYNLVTNRDSKYLIYGPFALFSIGSLQSSGGASANIIDLNAGGFVTWFLTQSSAAIRFEGFADLQQVSSSVAQTNLVGFGGRGLLILYF